MLGFSSFYGAFILQQRKIYYIIHSVIIMKKIAVINDLSGFGKCSLTAAIPVISAHGVQCCPLTTGIFSNQTGFDSCKYLDCTDIMQDFINEWKSLDVKFDGILSGFIANSKQGSIISDFIDDFKTPETLVVVDPVMADDGILYDCYDDNSVSQIIALTEKADIITPNLTELCIICDENYSETIKLPKEKLLDKIKAMSIELEQSVVTTGIQISDGKIASTVYQDGKFDIVTTQKIGRSFSGTGDILSSFITAQCVNGASLYEAVKRACAFIETSIKDTAKRVGEVDTYPYGTDFEPHLKDIEY